jgi:very-short-patch-repair endonuclease
VERLAREVGVELRRQVDVGATDWIGRVDFEIVGSTDIIEVLSERFHSAFLDREADTTRFRRLEASGRRVLTLWDGDVWGNAEAVRQRISSFWRDQPAR